MIMTTERLLVLLAVAFCCFHVGLCGVFSRGNSGGINVNPSNSAVANSNYQGLNQANGNVGSSRRASYLAGQGDGSGKKLGGIRTSAQNPASGVSAWGIIIIVVLVILLGFCGYYGIICYPLFFTKDNRYSTMDVSTTTTTSTPTRSSEFGKISEYDDDFQYKVNEAQQQNPNQHWS